MCGQVLDYHVFLTGYLLTVLLSNKRWLPMHWLPGVQPVSSQSISRVQCKQTAQQPMPLVMFLFNFYCVLSLLSSANAIIKSNEINSSHMISDIGWLNAILSQKEKPGFELIGKTIVLGWRLFPSWLVGQFLLSSGVLVGYWWWQRDREFSHHQKCKL